MIVVEDRSVTTTMYGPGSAFEFLMSDGQRWYLDLNTKGYIPNIGDEFHPSVIQVSVTRDFYHLMLAPCPMCGLRGGTNFEVDDDHTLHEVGR